MYDLVFEYEEFYQLNIFLRLIWSSLTIDFLDINVSCYIT